MKFDSWSQLRELSKLVIPLLPERRKELTGPLFKQSSNKIIQVIRLASDPAIKSESDIALSLGLTHSKGSGYKVTKSLSKARVLDSCFNLELRKQGYSRYFQHAYRNDRLTFLAKILTALGARQAATSITRSAFQESERLEIAVNAIETASLLRQSALLQGSTRLHAFYSSRIKLWLEVKEAELELEGIYDQLRISYSRRAVARTSDLEKAIYATEVARARMKKLDTFNVVLFGFRILTFHAQMQQEYKRCIELCLEAEAFIKNKPTFANTTRLAEFAIKRLVCSVHLRDLAEGQNAARACEEAYKAGTNNWYVVAENHFLLYTSCERFKDARDIWDRTTGEYNFAAQSETRKNRWAIFGLYLQLIEGTLTPRSSVPFSKSMQFKDLLSQVPATSVDKAGYNFALVILHILHLIEQQDWIGILDRIDAIKSYRIRHLNSQNSQSAAFLQLIVQLEKERNTAVDSTMAAAVQRLSKNGPLDSSVIHGLQIIPFDYLWTWILKTLGSKPSPQTGTPRTS